MFLEKVLVDYDFFTGILSQILVFKWFCVM